MRRGKESVALRSVSHAQPSVSAKRVLIPAPRLVRHPFLRLRSPFLSLNVKMLLKNLAVSKIIIYLCSVKQKKHRIMKQIEFTLDEVKNILFYLRSAETDLLLDWCDDTLDEVTRDAYKHLYFDLKSIVSSVENKLN